MGSNSNPSGVQEGSSGGGPTLLQSSAGGAGGGGVSINGTAPASATLNLGTSQALKHDPGLSSEWSAEELAILEEGLRKFSSDKVVVQYAKIALQLQGKTVRDIALRCRWMSKKESGKRRKEDHNLSRKSKDKKERVTDPSAKPSVHLVAPPSAPPYSLSMPPLDNDDDISYKAIGGETGQLLENNAQILHQVSANLTNFQIQENIALLCQLQNNLSTILNGMNETSGVMQQMPPLPVRINEELANSILSRRT